MQVFLVKEYKNSLIKKILKIIETKEDKIIINDECKKMRLKKKMKIANEINRILKINKSNKIILSNTLKQDQEFSNLLYSNGIDIINGKILYKILISKIIEKICRTNNISKEELKIGITINNVNEWGINLIEELSKKTKTVNVVTDKTNQLNNLQKRLYEENGVIITVTNNKKKALIKCNLILNVDFPEELLNRYLIFDNSIIINLEEAVKIKKKRFNGKIINDYKITLKEGSEIKENLEKQEYEEFDIKDLAEIYIINKPEEIENVIICD